jgi:WD40 repeat protein/tRNA A-37 threonylcarbamoyl transferase component Bud32
VEEAMNDDPQAGGRARIDRTAAGLEGALEAAYGAARRDAVEDASVLVQLERKGVRAERVLLRDSAEQDTPVVRPGARDAPGGRYQTVGEVARGGVGVILKCRDVDLGRDVAMKVLHSDHADNAQLTERFVEEAQIAGQLQHPGIVPVYELGLTEEGRPYFTMKFIKGDTLAALLSNREDPAHGLSRMLGIFQQVCMAVAYAHSRGVIHRDLKPANVILGAFGEVMVVDWGFAKVLAHGGVADERLSRAKREPQQTVVHTLRSGSTPGSGSDSVAGSVMGTPAYMPPEQALGDIDSMDARSDVFGLGAILCEILTGLPPYVRGDLSPIVQAAQGRLDDAFGRLDECVADEALVSLCKRCLDLVPARRPPDGGALGRAVADHLQGVEERAQRARIAALTARRTRRWALAAAAALLVGLGVSIVAWRETGTQRDFAEAARTDLEARNSDLELVAYASALRRASDAIAAGDLDDVEGILAQTQPSHRGFEFDWLRMQALGLPRPRILDTGGGRVTVIELSPDASVVAVADTASNVSAWDVASGRNLWRVPDLGHALAWAPDGGAVAALRLDGRLTVVDARTGGERARATVRAPAYRLAVSRDGGRVAVTSLDGRVSVLGMDTLAPVHELEVDRSVREICWSPDGTRLLVSVPDRAVILDAASGARGHSFAMESKSWNAPPTAAAPTSVDWSSAGERVLVCFEGGGSGIWNAETGILLHELEPHSIRNVSGGWRAFSGRFCGPTAAVTAGRDDRVRIHDVLSGRRRGMFGPGALGVGLVDSRREGVRWRGPGTPLLTWGTSSRLFVCDVAALALPEDIEDPHIYSNVVCSPGAGALFYVTTEGELVRRDRRQGRIEWARPVGKVSGLASQYDGCRHLPKAGAVVVVTEDLRLTLVDAGSGEVRQTLTPSEDIVAACSGESLYPMGIDVSPDEARVACAIGTTQAARDYGFPAPVLVYDLGVDPEVRAVGRHAGTALEVRFVPGTDQLCSSGANGEVLLWDARRGVPWGQNPVALRELSSTDGYALSLDVSPDGRLAAVGHVNGRIHVYDLETGQERTEGPPIRLHEHVEHVSFDPQTNRLLAIGTLGAVALFDLEGVTLLRTSLAFGEGRQYFLAPDRTYLLATPHYGGAVHVRPLRVPSGSRATARAPASDGSLLDQGADAALRTWGTCIGPDEVRERLIEDPDLDEDVRAAALGLVPYLGDNTGEILRRIMRIARSETVTPADRETLVALQHRGLAAQDPGSLTYGAFLAVVAASEPPSSEWGARNGELAEAVIRAHQDPDSQRSSAFRSLYLPRAVLAARRGDRAAALAHLDQAEAFLREALGGRDGPEPQLSSEQRAEVEAFLAR